MITDYATFGDVRAVLGVSDYELTDATLALTVYSSNLDNALAGISGILDPDTEERTLAAQYIYLEEVSSPTADQTKLLNSIKLYAIYVVAGQASGALSMYAPKTQADGKSNLTRFSSDATFRDAVGSIHAKISTVVADIYELFGVAPSAIDYLIAVTPAEDLVTGETT